MAGTELGGIPVSAPGAASTRTDLAATQPPMHIPSAYYGDGVETDALQSAAPMYASPPPQRPPGLFTPTERPNEPVTSGIDFGAGPDSSALTPPENLMVPAADVAGTLRRLSASPAVSPRVAGLARVIERLGW